MKATTTHSKTLVKIAATDDATGHDNAASALDSAYRVWLKSLVDAKLGESKVQSVSYSLSGTKHALHILYTEG